MNDVIDKLLASLTYPDNGCWICTLCPKMRYPSIKHNTERLSVHRFAYELFVGPIPEGFDVHHSCEHQRCCNPDHLEALSELDHYRLHKVKTHCKHGHAFTPENTYFWRGRPGHQMCKQCMRDNLRASRARKPKRPDPRTLRTHCKHGHEFTLENTYRYHGHRACKECMRRLKKEHRSKQKIL